MIRFAFFASLLFALAILACQAKENGGGLVLVDNGPACEDLAWRGPPIEAVTDDLVWRGPPIEAVTDDLVYRRKLNKDDL